MLGATGILVHSFEDFNLQIPANAALFYVLCAIAASDTKFATHRRARRSRASALAPPHRRNIVGLKYPSGLLHLEQRRHCFHPSHRFCKRRFSLKAGSFRLADNPGIVASWLGREGYEGTRFLYRSAQFPKG